MLRVSYATINRRKGTGLIPPNRNQWNVEHHALNLREELGVSVDVPLDHSAAFALLPATTVFGHGELPVAQEFIQHFRAAGMSHWSGMAVTVAPGVEWVIYNDAHALTRVRATLMEEFFHVRFDHDRSKIRVYGGNGDPRTFDREAEEEAYHTGAAALVPYAALRKFVARGKSTRAIAKHYRVSPELVRFRAKVTKLYAQLSAGGRS